MNTYSVYHIEKIDRFCDFLEFKGYSANYKGGYTILTDISDTSLLELLKTEYTSSNWKRLLKSKDLLILNIPGDFNTTISFITSDTKYNLVRYNVYNNVCILEIFIDDKRVSSEQVINRGEIDVDINRGQYVEIKARNIKNGISIVSYIKLVYVD